MLISDPDTHLDRLRKLASWDSDTQPGSLADNLTELQESVTRLDVHLASGGELPQRWSGLERCPHVPRS